MDKYYAHKMYFIQRPMERICNHQRCRLDVDIDGQAEDMDTNPADNSGTTYIDTQCPSRSSNSCPSANK